MATTSARYTHCTWVSPRVQKPGRNGTGTPSEPEVKPRQRLAMIFSTSAKAIVDSAKYGPLRRLDRKPMTPPATSDSATPATSPSHGLWW